MRIEYTAVERNGKVAAAGLTNGLSYEIAALHREALPSFRDNSVTARGMGGAYERDYAYTDEVWTLQTDYIDSGQPLLEFDAFLHSVRAGEQFIFDPDSDTLTVAVNPFNVFLLDVNTPRRRGGPLRFLYTLRLQRIF